MTVDVLALSDASTAALAALGGALIGGAASFTGTYWERRTERRYVAAEAVRQACSAVIEAVDQLTRAARTASVAPHDDDVQQKLDAAMQGVLLALRRLSLHPHAMGTLSSQVDAVTDAADGLPGGQTTAADVIDAGSQFAVAASFYIGDLEGSTGTSRRWRRKRLR